MACLTRVRVSQAGYMCSLISALNFKRVHNRKEKESRQRERRNIHIKKGANKKKNNNTMVSCRLLERLHCSCNDSAVRNLLIFLLTVTQSHGLWQHNKLRGI